MNSFSLKPTMASRIGRTSVLVSPSTDWHGRCGETGQVGWARPGLAQANAWWHQMFADGIPHRRDLDPLSMPLALLPLAVVAERYDHGADSADWLVRLAGTLVCDRAGCELRGHRFRAAFGDIAPQKLDRTVAAVVATRRPATFRHTIADGWGGLEWAETGLFPLSETGDHIDGLLAFIDPDPPHS